MKTRKDCGFIAAVAVCLAFTQTAQCMDVVTVEGREPSLLPQGKKFKFVWNDEFDGDRLDASKWSYRYVRVYDIVE